MSKFVAAAVAAGLSAVSFAAAASSPFGQGRSTQAVNFPGTIVDAAVATPALSTLTSLVVAANLAGPLSAPGNLTVYAPTNDAFAGAPGGLTTQQLTTVLTYHVLSTQVLSTAIPFGQPVTTLANQDITIEAGTAPVIATITDTTATPAEIQAVDVRASNGVIHVIDKVLIPSLGT